MYASEASEASEASWHPSKPKQNNTMASHRSENNSMTYSFRDSYIHRKTNISNNSHRNLNTDRSNIRIYNTRIRNGMINRINRSSNFISNDRISNCNNGNYRNSNGSNSNDRNSNCFNSSYDNRKCNGNKISNINSPSKYRNSPSKASNSPGGSSTVFSSLYSTSHGRQRRQGRLIQKSDLQRARRYGMKEAAKFTRSKYTFAGIVFIYDERQRRDITSYCSSDKASLTFGTKSGVPPILLEKNQMYCQPAHMEEHRLNKIRIENNKIKWTSHAVFVVDMSGSMRHDDINGARCRSDAVWTVLARDFVKAQLEARQAHTMKTTNSASSATPSVWDVVSIIIMRDCAHVVIEHYPLDWVLYNTLVDMREWSQIRPQGPGNYLPALERAEALLASNHFGTCALSLLFLSDGKASDYGQFAKKAGEIASKYRRSLTFTCVGIAQEEEKETFQTLRDMVSEAEAFGAKSFFNRPSLDTSSLSHIFSSVSSSLTSTKMELQNSATGTHRTVRLDVRSERLGTVDDVRPTNEWRVYCQSSQSNTVRRFWTWSIKMCDFVQLRDPRCVSCHMEEPGGKPRSWCTRCKVTVICEKCKDTAFNYHNSHSCNVLREALECGKISDDEDLPSSVAMKVPIFGEGAERIVRKFRFVSSNGMHFIGPKMVAKESRFVEPNESYRRERAFHANFMRTQSRASDIASSFNEALGNLREQFLDDDVVFVDKLPRIEFLVPMLVEVLDQRETKHILIERYLEGKYEKFNNNKGFVKGQTFYQMDFDDVFGLDTIEEDTDNDDDDDGHEDVISMEDLHDSESCGPPGISRFRNVEDYMFPQAFSHFSFEESNKAFMVVDLQGVFEKNTNSCKFILTDPAIHTKQTNEKQLWKNRHDFGRTDGGTNGMKAFFASHTCTDACRLLGLRKVNPQTLQYIISTDNNDDVYE